MTRHPHLAVIALVERWGKADRGVLVVHHLLLVLVVLARNLLEVRVQLIPVLNQVHLVLEGRRLVVRVVAVVLQILAVFDVGVVQVEAWRRRNGQMRQDVAEGVTRWHLAMSQVPQVFQAEDETLVEVVVWCRLLSFLAILVIIVVFITRS